MLWDRRQGILNADFGGRENKMRRKVGKVCERALNLVGFVGAESFLIPCECDCHFEQDIANNYDSCSQCFDSDINKSDNRSTSCTCDTGVSASQLTAGSRERRW